VTEFEHPRRIDGQMHADLRRTARILDLVAGRNQQRTQFVGHLLRRAGQQLRHGRCQAQIPAQRTERDGAYGSAILAPVRGQQGFIRRLAG